MNLNKTRSGTEAQSERPRTGATDVAIETSDVSPGESLLLSDDELEAVVGGLNWIPQEYL